MNDGQERRKVLDLSRYREKGKALPGRPAGQERGKRLPGILGEHRWLLLALLLVAAIDLMPTPPGLSVAGKYALGLWAFVVVCFLTEALPLPMTALFIGSYQIFTGIGTFHEVPRTFMDDAVIFIMGVLMTGAMLIKYNIHNRVTLYMLRLSGPRIERIVLGMVAFCAFGAAFITEHAAVVIMLPVGVGLVSLCGGYQKVPNLARLLMLAISYGVIIGGVASPSGGARNALMIGLLNSLGLNVGYGQWMLMAAPFTLIMIPVVTYWLLSLYPPEISDLTRAVGSIQKEMEAAGPMTGRARAMLAIFLAVLAGWLFLGHRFGVGNIAMAGVILAAVFRLVDWSYLQSKTQWGVVLLYAGAISMGRMLISTGAAAWLAGQLLHLAAAAEMTEGLHLLAVTATITALVTNTMADGPTVAVLGPVFLKVAELSHISPVATGVATSLAAAFSFLLVIATPANAIVYGPGFLRPVDFLKAGGVLFLLSLVLLIALLANLWWRAIGIW
ncbi:MAG: DASS family sodium-coupled anion symporter [Thermoanaerobacteraceae bacterium]|nr:DASS family sodium-coupled anion symporter [Thermoanaerobacteraceae bacterium]